MGSKYQKKILEDEDLQREIYSTLLQDDNKYSSYSKGQVLKYVMDYSNYSEWIWCNKINLICPAPFAFHIKTGSFIADEMRGQVVGLWRERMNGDWSSLAVMTKSEWRDMDDEYLRIRTTSEGCEYYIINTEQMECDIDIQLLEAMDYLEENGVVPDDIDEYLCERLELEAERRSDILRGK